MEYPVLNGLLIWAEGLATRTIWGTATTAARFVFVVSAANATPAFAVLRIMARAGLIAMALLCWGVVNATIA